MEKHSLVNRPVLDSGRIDYDAFTASLAQEAARVGLLDEAEMARIQEELLTVLSEQITALTKGESTSIPAEAADRLMDGIGYCIDCALRVCPTLELSLALLKASPIQELYEAGTSQLQSHARACESLLSRVRATRLQTENEGYNLTLDVSLPQLLRDWKCRPFPGDFAVIIEYPLAAEPYPDGIAGLHQRLSALALENRFCARFRTGLEQLLADYARQNRVSPQEAYVNFFTIVLQNLLLCRLAGLEGMELDTEARDALQARLIPLSPEQRQQLVLHACALLLEECAFENPALEDYIRSGAERFAASLNASGGRLRYLAVLHERGRLIHTDGEKLGNDAFAAVAEALRLCETAAQKAALLREEVRSLDDLCDLLGAGSIYEGEWNEIFDSFDDATAALIQTRIPPEPEEDDWQAAFSRWLDAAASERRETILQLFHSFCL